MRARRSAIDARQLLGERGENDARGIDLGRIEACERAADRRFDRACLHAVDLAALGRELEVRDARVGLVARSLGEAALDDALENAGERAGMRRLERRWRP